MKSGTSVLGIVGRAGRILLLLAVLGCGRVEAQPRVVRYPPPESADDDRPAYYLELLDLVLRKAGGAYRLEAAPLVMPQGRALVQLQKGQDVDVVWTMTTAERERGLRPIRIPLLRGLIGTRLLLIRASDAERFAALQKGDDLRRLVAGQGHDWPDTKILRANGLSVHGSASYEALFRMLRYGRIDYFPRSVLEIWDEADQYHEQGLVAEDHLVLHYPAAFYFFVNPADDDLADRLERGLRRAMADGSYDALFERYFGAILARARLDERLHIELDNPLLPPDPPAATPDYWHEHSRPVSARPDGAPAGSISRTP